MLKPNKLRRALAVALCLGLTGASPVHAQAPRPLGLRIKSACPGRDLVVSELTPLLRGYALSDSADSFAEIEDLGDSYTMNVAGASREVRDPGRQCLERARVAAVFLALNLPSPSPSPSPSPPAPPKAAPRQQSPDSSEPDVAPRAVPPRDPRAFEVRPFALAESAWGAGVASTGVGLAASFRRGSMAVTLLGAATTSTTPYQNNGEPTHFELRRLPLAALLGWEASLGMLGLGAETGLALDVLRFDGKAVPHAEQALRLNPGLRLNAVLRVRASRLLSAELMPIVAWFPRTYLVRVEPATLLAETPRFWLGVSLGLNCQVWGG
jgi:hypothetical protein